MESKFTPYAHLNQSEKNKRTIEEESEKWQTIKKELLDEIEPDEEGINPKRAVDFVSAQGITPRDYIIFNERELRKIFEIYKKHSFKFDEAAYASNWAAMEHNDLDIALIRRQRDYEKFNGPIATERYLVHELGHGASGYSGCVIENDRVTMPRTGSAVGLHWETAKGHFIEEGFVESLANDYSNMHATPESRKIVSRYFPGDKDPLGNLVRPIYFLNERYKKVYFPLSNNYYSVYKDGESLATACIDYAAYGMNLLYAKAPELKQTLIESKKDINSLRKVPKILNGLAPNLYQKLRELPYNDEGFGLGVAIIVDSVYGGKIGNKDYRSLNK